MRIDFENFKLRRDFDRIEVLHWLQLGLFTFAFLFEVSLGLFFIWGILKILVILLVYKLFLVTKKELFYSYWTFATFLFLYTIGRTFAGVFGYQDPTLSFLFFLLSTLIFSEGHILYSPIYYPRIRWWVYDFRYRNEFKIIVKEDEPKEDENESKGFDGRLTDLRRAAGCVVLFKDFKIGDTLKITPVEEIRDIQFTTEIMSKREYSIGRGISYGVKFHLENSEERDFFNYLADKWKDEVKMTKMKFREELNLNE